VNGNRREEWLVWCLGSALFAGVVASFGINYINHLLMSFFLLLAFISIATAAMKPTVVRDPDEPTQEQLDSVEGEVPALPALRI
jgi:hypothetical protein